MGPKLKIHIKRGTKVKTVPFIKCAFGLPKMLAKCCQLRKKMLMKHLIAVVVHTQNIISNENEFFFSFLSSVTLVCIHVQPV